MIWIKIHSPKIGLQRFLGYLLVLRVTHTLHDTNDTQSMFFYNFITRFDFHFLPKVRHHQCAPRNLEVWLTKCILTSSGFCASFLSESPRRKEVAMYKCGYEDCQQYGSHEVYSRKRDIVMRACYEHAYEIVDEDNPEYIEICPCCGCYIPVN